MINHLNIGVLAQPIQPSPKELGEFLLIQPALEALLRVLLFLADGTIPMPGGKHYFLPLTATYSMRMQSNFHRKWALSHPNRYAP